MDNNYCGIKLCCLNARYYLKIKYYNSKNKNNDDDDDDDNNNKLRFNIPIGIL